MSHSPYKHMQGSRVDRLDLILLEGLSQCKGPASTDAVMQISDPRDFAKLELEQVVHTLTMMLADGYVERVGAVSSAFGNLLHWQITDKGRAHLVAAETRAVLSEVVNHTPVRPQERHADYRAPRIEEVPELGLNARLRASHAKLDAEGVPPAKTTLCVDEFELDDWWANLDIEIKAEVFALWSLGNYEGHTSRTGDLHIPVVGTIGDAASSTANEDHR